MNNVSMHEGFVPAYQMSSIPFVTASVISQGEIQQYNFNQVTRFFNVKNNSSNITDCIAISFTQNGLRTKNYFTLLQGESFREEIRCVDLYISCSAGTSVTYELIAGLTNIPRNQFQVITGSAGYQSVG